jgi:hypothetical protein
MSEPVWELNGPDWEPIEMRVGRLLRAFLYVPLTQQTLVKVRLRLQEFCIPVIAVEGAIRDDDGVPVIRITLDDGTWIEWP